MRPSRLVPHFFGKNSNCTILGLVSILIVAMGMPSSFAIAQIMLDTPTNSYIAGDSILVKGQIANAPGQLVAIEVKDPAGVTMMVRTVKTGSDGSFILQFKLSPSAQSGSYNIIANSNMGGNTVKTTKLISVSSHVGKTISDKKIRIPMWVKSNANWWSTGKITDSDFGMGIGYLIKNGIIIMPYTAGSYSPQTIPGWVKNDAGWWSEQQISDSEFVGALQYLITNGIIIIK